MAISSHHPRAQSSIDTKLSPIPVEVYLPSLVFRGTLLTRHNRLSDWLNLKSSDSMLRLDDVEVEMLSGKPSFAKCQDALINKQQITFVIDLSPAGSHQREELSLVHKEPHRVFAEIGSFWLEGNIHVAPGFDLSTFADGKNTFLPLTDASFVNLRRAEPRTLLINREKLSCLLPFTEAIPAAVAPTLTRQSL